MRASKHILCRNLMLTIMFITISKHILRHKLKVYATCGTQALQNNSPWFDMCKQINAIGMWVSRHSLCRKQLLMIMFSPSQHILRRKFKFHSTCGAIANAPMELSDILYYFFFFNKTCCKEVQVSFKMTTISKTRHSFAFFPDRLRICWFCVFYVLYVNCFHQAGIVGLIPRPLPQEQGAENDYSEKGNAHGNMGANHPHHSNRAICIGIGISDGGLHYDGLWPCCTCMCI